MSCARSSHTGPRRASPWIGSETGSRPSWIGASCAAIARPAPTPRDGRDISIRCCRRTEGRAGEAPRGDDYTALPSFMAELRDVRTSVAARALEFLILTAAGAAKCSAPVGRDRFRRGDVDVPAGRMKAKREHRVRWRPPLSILCGRCRARTATRIVFIGSKPGRGSGRYDAYGCWSGWAATASPFMAFRSAFSDWAHESTATQNHTIELRSPTMSAPKSRGRTGAGRCWPSACGSWPTGPSIAASSPASGQPLRSCRSAVADEGPQRRMPGAPGGPPRRQSACRQRRGAA